jgi:UDP-glucose:(heptosyl)LPS alpha-1,3-glucosyltransferase
MKKNNGSTRHVSSQSLVLKQLGYDVTILSENISNPIREELQVKWQKVYRWPLKGYYQRVLYNVQIQRWLSKNPQDLFVSNSWAFTDDILVLHNCLELARDVQKKSSTSIVNCLIKRQIEILRDKRFKLLVAVSELMKRDIVKRYNIDSEKISVLYPGADLSVFNRDDSEEKRNKGRIIAGIPSDTICVGLITSGDFNLRNVDFFLRFARKLATSLTGKVHFIITGKDDGSLKTYQEFAVKMGLEDAVTFIPFVEDVQFLYHALDLFVLPSYLDTFGYVVIESLASGIPCLISENVGASELMTKEGLPFVFSGYDEDEWVKAALTILNDEKFAKELADKSNAVGCKYSLKGQINKMAKLFQPFVTRKSSLISSD